MNEYVTQAEHFLEECVFDGLAHSWDTTKRIYVKPYPEVTGYIIRYFCDYADTIPDNMMNAANYLIDIQDSSTGGFRSFQRDDILYTFDTAQIIRGLVGAYRRFKEKRYLDAAKIAGEFVLLSQEKCGAFKPYFNCNEEAWVIRDETYKIWNGPYSGLMCKVTEALGDLLVETGDGRYAEAIDQAGVFYAGADYIEYTHPLGYWLEGLIACGRSQLVQRIIEDKILCRLRADGFIAYAEELSYAYVSGTIQIGIILCKMGYFEEAIRIRDYGRLVQSCDSSGGLFQYADRDGVQNKEIHSEINSWGTKYFCELERMIQR